MAGSPAAPPRAPAGRWVRPSPAVGGLEPVLAADPLGAPLPPELAAYAGLVRRLGDGKPVAPEASALADEAAAVWARPGLDTFVSLPRLRARVLPHQIQAAAGVLRRLHGRAILADEPGLGAAIEAGLVVSELRLRGLARRALVLVPGTLVAHWEEQLERVFALPCTLAGPGAHEPHGAGEGAVVITSLAAAVRSPLRETLVAQPWDVVVVDEAHRVKSARTAAGRLVRALSARRLLLLTPVPVEESPDDLLQLASLVRPGRLDGQVLRARGPAGPHTELRARLRDVMVRHRRSEVATHLSRRSTDTRVVAPAGDEAAVYAAVASRARGGGRADDADHVLALRDALRRAGSSLRAAAPALRRLGWADLADRADATATTAAHDAVVDVLREHIGRHERVLVVAGFRPTVDVLARRVAAAGIDTAVYHAGLPRTDKNHVVGRFASGAGPPVLVSTEAAGEGRDLTSCRVLVNADLPWDPLQLDRRIARLQRAGQSRDVLVTTVVLRGTIEERLARVVDSRLALSELVPGELDSVVARLGEDVDLEAEVLSAYVASADEAEAAARLDDIGEALSVARAGYLASRRRTDELIGGVVP